MMPVMILELVLELFQSCRLGNPALQIKSFIFGQVNTLWLLITLSHHVPMQNGVVTMDITHFMDKESSRYKRLFA